MAYGCMGYPNDSLRVVDAIPKTTSTSDFVLPLLELFAVDQPFAE